MKHWVTRILIIVVVLGLLVGAGAWYATRGSSGGGSFKTATVARQEIVATISATGTVKNNKQVDYGSQVEEGTILAKIDDSVYQSDVASATAQLNAAKAGVQR